MFKVVFGVVTILQLVYFVYIGEKIDFVLQAEAIQGQVVNVVDQQTNTYSPRVEYRPPNGDIYYVPSHSFLSGLQEQAGEFIKVYYLPDHPAESLAASYMWSLPALLLVLLIFIWIPVLALGFFKWQSAKMQRYFDENSGMTTTEEFDTQAMSEAERSELFDRLQLPEDMRDSFVNRGGHISVTRSETDI
ncbi:DUF3592 domain-containing protein [Amphritea pacifica]|uniref:DUF3592 domain-containing protein n=1 Tax=Amphritea pacifica TaxID=2811233 RepID=A0ABS2W5D8_9GAMM|nr:DUF3592 domain-containing protein [Amphritea pacifica]MBN1005373.1 DUF3592 domain-containing protein [Amphritea pacifica]